MKKLLLIASLALFASCSFRTAPTASTLFVDVNEFYMQGFLILPGAFLSAAYTPVGQITTVVSPGKKVSPWAGRRSSGQMSFRDAVSQMVTDAKARGADCILDFKFEIVGENYVLKGFAVKTVPQQ